jgi:hypothetical protein
MKTSLLDVRLDTQTGINPLMSWVLTTEVLYINHLIISRVYELTKIGAPGRGASSVFSDLGSNRRQHQR